ncbi:MAG: energy transducer TonB, partial [Gammaproteobacteria bacterium]|nr:energy transducer TonB [Gammaproteobacteria bacterium]
MTSNSRKARAERILSGSALANLVSMVVMFFPLSALSAAQDEVEIELFTGPSTAKMVSPVYPRSRQRDGAEGWVQLNFMVGVEGNAYEVAVSDSTGDESFEKAAIKAVQRSKFEPASMNGEPTDAGHALKIVFSLRGAHGASRKFVNAYKQLMKAIAADDRQKSDALVTELQAMAASNLYEDAYLHVARFVYLQKWGDSHQQLNSLMRAVAYEQSDSYLPEKVYRSVLGSLFALQVETRDYSGALRTF